MTRLVGKIIPMWHSGTTRGMMEFIVQQADYYCIYCSKFRCLCEEVKVHDCVYLLSKISIKMSNVAYNVTMKYMMLYYCHYSIIIFNKYATAGLILGRSANFK